MSRLLLLEPIGGISGDMFLGAVADLGADLGVLAEVLRGIGLDGFEIRSERATEHAITGTRVSVTTAAARSGDPHGEPRGWREIRTLLQRLPPAIAPRALAAFGRLAEVEAQIHGVSPEEVHFHELGAVDSIVDIAGGAWALDALGVDEVVSRPPPLGSGTTQSQHGVIPVPAPATLALLRGVPVLLEGNGEMTTPTGAAILSTWASFELPARLTLSRIGYGLGHAHWADRPNLLRASLGDAESLGPTSRSIVLLEAHLDDASPQLLGHLIDRLMEAGALDAGLSPLLMKKGRAGQRLTVVCDPAARSALSDLILRESPTLGVRVSTVEREELARELVTVETEFGSVHVKIGRLGAEVVNVAAEYDDCVALARAKAVPLKRVLAAAAAASDHLWSRKRS
jgi:pyridinium-3,5-bisthiocarboxylic acid mononucleotide nickel chelatase